MFNKIWNFWNDMKVPLGIIVGFTVVLPFTAGGGLLLPCGDRLLLLVCQTAVLQQRSAV